MGMFDNIVKIGGQTGSVEGLLNLASANPVVSGVKAGLNMLPDGQLKDVLSMSAGAWAKKLADAIFGRQWQIGNYRVGERYLDQVLPNGNPDTAKSWQDVPNEIVFPAQNFMTVSFGVRITNQEDLDALEQGVAAYQARPDKADIPLAAIQRAVRLKQTYFPDSTYNRVKWDLSKFESNPLVAPIPGLTPNTLYSGELPGGAIAKNGVIEGDGMLKQVIGMDPNTPIVLDPATPKPTALAGMPTWLIVGLAGAAIFMLMPKKKGR